MARFRMPQGLTALGLLYRLLVLLRRLAVAQERIADASELRIKATCARFGVSVKELRELDLESEGEAELIHFDEEELALRRRLLEEAEARGWKLELGEDVIGRFEREGFPVRAKGQAARELEQ